MIKHFFVATALTFASFAAQEASAYTLYTPAQRAAIRSMPITQRPYRPGHFYGNTVRAVHRIVVR